MTKPRFASRLVTVRIPGRPYPIIVGRRMTPHLAGTLRTAGAARDVVVITDRTVARLYLRSIHRSLERGGFRVLPVVVPSGEAQKSAVRANDIFTTMLRGGIGRNGTVIALGGGVVGDLAGFVASVYQRGIRLVQMPTTLLSQVDSSIGGKVAVNHPLGKNMIGSFYQPSLVWTDASFLRTLPQREVVCGLGEVVKYGVIRDAAFFRWLEANVDRVMAGEMDAIMHVQGVCSTIKANLCATDEKEHGIRVILNYGHTVGHALEAAGDYRRIKHGEAVLLGMKAETWLATELGLLSAAAAERINRLIGRVPVKASRTRGMRPSDILAAMTRDKKSLSGRKRFVLPVRIGAVRVIEGVEPALVRRSLETIL